MRSIILLPLILAGMFCCSVTAADPSAERSFLLDGVTSIGASGVPGPLCLYGPDAFPVVLGKASDEVALPVMAAAAWGKGRVVAFGHTGYLDDHAMLAGGEMPRLMGNAIRWTAGGRPSATGVRLGVFRNPRLREVFAARGLDAAEVTDLTRLTVECLVLSPTALRTDDELRSVVEYVERGGGLITANLGWGWLQLNPGKELADHPGNRLLSGAGIAWADGTLRTTSAEGFSAIAEPSKWVAAPAALDALLAHHRGERRLSAADLRQIVGTLEVAARSVPPGDTLFLPRLTALEQTVAAEAFPTAERPLTADQPLARLVTSMRWRSLSQADPETTLAHPAANDFPGAVPAEAPRVTKSLRIDTRIPNWQSTGLYAAPGETIRVRIGDDAARWNRPLSLRIGCHSDRLWHLDAWRRMPEITCERPLKSVETVHGSPFGGLIYVVVPEGVVAGEVVVEIQGAVEAPLYVLDETPLDAWLETIRKRPAPWAELATKNVIISIPSAYVRGLDDPESLMRFWDRVLDACADLAAQPRERRRPERMVADRQISAGYMHAGYPIMTPTSDDVCRDYTELARLRRGNWGFFHELGHNHQSSHWTFSGTVEVTVNLFTLYVYDKVCDIRPVDARDVLSPAGRQRKMQAYFDNGAPFPQWRNDPFLALIMYVQLQEAFGWEAFQAVFAEYLTLEPWELPRDDAAKRDQWMVRFSRHVGRDLGPFFERWGVPTTEAARQSIQSLPVWMPPEWE